MYVLEGDYRFSVGGEDGTTNRDRPKVLNDTGG
jgi:hypothetical protein